jgi:4-carboxymuconolactone decarboxylase
MARLVPIQDKANLPENKHHIFDYLVETRGAVSPGFGSLLHHPDVAFCIAQLGTQIRFHSSLPNNVREITALTASMELDGVYEQAIHTRDAAREGVAQSTIDAVNQGSEPAEAAEDEALAMRCARELTRSHQLSDEAFELARQRFGESGVVELIATIAYYSMLAYVHNALQVWK